MRDGRNTPHKVSRNRFRRCCMQRFKSMAVHFIVEVPVDRRKDSQLYRKDIFHLPRTEKLGIVSAYL
ncbi:hypothetical protein J6590_007774 [Homalodisca vitripennis]|nr:hypothetical protein J6590_007774 [Homalodisca vitripennis]